MEEARYFQTPLTQDSYHEDEVIDTLSLSDLLIYDYNGDHPQADHFYQLKDQNPNLEVDDQPFEFSTELLKTPGGSNVVFCGKIIPYKEPNVFQTSPKLESKKKSHKKRWGFVRFFKKSSKPKSNMDSEKVDFNYEVPIRRVSILASATKPRWYLFMFGFGSSSFTAQMHIKDLKRRKTSMGAKNSKDKKRNGDGIGSWRLATLLGCGGGGSKHHPNVMKIE